MNSTIHSLKKKNTFGIDCYADRWMEINHLDDLISLSERLPEELLILGGGSNILFTQEKLDQIAVINNFKGHEVISEDSDRVVIRANSGENWDQFVRYTIAQGYGGLENLTLIPGTVGAAPMQNIGAYGVEVKNCITGVHFWDMRDQQHKTLATEECLFGYRSSIFKNLLKGVVFITAVDFRLSKRNHQLELSYGAIQQKLASDGITNPSISDVSRVVEDIRRSKLPDPAEVGNAGSFFKNPTIAKEFYLTLPHSGEMPFYDLGNDHVKIPAAWLIEKAGWKGYREGDIGVYPDQALVLVNYGNGKGKDIFELSERIIASVEDKFSISLEREVNIL